METLAGRRSADDSLAQSFKEPFQMRHAFAQPSEFFAQAGDLGLQARFPLLHVLPQPCLHSVHAGQDQATQGHSHRDHCYQEVGFTHGQRIALSLRFTKGFDGTV